jgi:hypothetical protein
MIDRSFVVWLATLLSTAAMTTVTALSPIPARAQVGLSLQVGQPGYFGQLNVGNLPPPQLVFPAPITIVQRPWMGWAQPIYLRVPPDQTMNWGRYCTLYNACSRPVYFVRDEWYRRAYAPQQVYANPGWRRERERWAEHEVRRDEWNQRAYAPQQLHSNRGWGSGRERWAEHDDREHQWREHHD